MPEARMSMENRANDLDKKALEFIENVTRNADEVQAQVLAAILTRNADTEYLKKYGLNGRTDRATFKKCLPVITYDDLKSEIHRIANGDTSPILSAHPVSEFLTSSGTSAGERKLMPTIQEELERKTHLYSLLMPVMNQYMQGLDKGKGMYFFFIKSEAKTPGGLLARPVLTSFYKSRYFKERPYDPYNVYTSPNATVLCPDAYQSMYSQLLCGLLQNNEVLRMGAVFASGFIRAIRFLEVHWKQFCLDIKTGSLNREVTDSSVRDAVGELLHPNPELADFVERQCSVQSWQGIITRLWPSTRYIDVIVTGAMAQYISTLDYYSGGLPLVCTMYASSECYFGLNLKPLCKPSEVSYTLLPNMAYFEFLPVHRKQEEAGVTLESPAIPKTLDEKERQELVELVDVKLGQEYELVVTTYAGLNRYRVGDVLRVTGFHNAAPQFHFVCRQNVVLSIDSDKTDEEELHSAVENSVKHLQPFDAQLIEYTSYADTSTIPGHYVLYWELRFNSKADAVAVPSSVFEDCCLTVEESLNTVYRQGRASDNSIGPLEIRVVEKGTFDQLMDYALSRGASINQYKAPRCIKFTPIVELLNSRVVHSYFSPQPPQWAPGCRKWALT